MGEYKDKKVMIKLNELETEVRANINGRLKAIILMNEDPISIEIKSSLGFPLFKELNRKGNHYFPLKVKALNHKAEKNTFWIDDYILQEDVLIKVEGKIGSSIMVIFRYE